MRNPASILITGASSGIGAALAELYAAPGVTLSLGGRNRERTEAVAEICRGKGATAHPHVHDVSDAEGMAAWIAEADARAPLELAVANAGVTARSLFESGNGAPQARGVFAINVDGVVNTVLPALAAMRPRGRGQIAVMSSLASFVPVPGSAAYCASKSAVRSWAEALRAALRGEGIEVSAICPGWVYTPMTEGNRFPMPLAMSAARSARIIRRGLARNRGRIAFPFTLYTLARLTGALPPALRDSLLRRLPDKDADFL